MAPKLYKTLVGAFVIGGIALFTTGIVLLGGRRLFYDSLEYTLYFDGSVSGLSIGAPVVFRGVPMGNVIKISLVANARDSNITIPVTIQIDERSFINSSGAPLSEATQSEIIHRMVEKGLRARLQMGSLITGQYRIELDFFPHTPMNFRSSDPDTEIPTIPSPIDTLQRTFARLPIDQIASSMVSILDNITDAVGHGQLKTAVDAFTSSFTALRNLLEEGSVRDALEKALASVDSATNSVQRELPGALASFREAMTSFSRSADMLRKVSESAEAALGKDSPTMNDLRRLLRDSAQAARALRNFADMLERNPEALLRGKQGSR